MGLLKDTATNYGFTAQYWHIARVNHEFEGKTSAVLLNGFVTKAARDTGAMAVVSKSITFEGDDFKPEATRADLYTKIKELPDFTGATDD